MRRRSRALRACSPVASLSGSEVGRGTAWPVFRPPSLASEAVLAAAGPSLAVLRRHASGLAQLSVQTDRGAVVLTPLADPAGAALVLGAAPLDGSLALLEILALRVAAPPPAAADAVSGDELEPVSGGPAADLAAGALTAFGALTPSVVRDPADRVEVCLLHPPGEPVRDVATVAHAVCCALSAIDDHALGAVRGAVLRLAAGGRRLALRPVAHRPGHWIAMIAPPGDARPGLVELEIGRAAARVAR